jgi:hypothetical protein
MRLAYAGEGISPSGFRKMQSTLGGNRPAGNPGGQRTYTDIAIEAALTIRMVFHLPLRQAEGFLRSLADLLHVDLPIPDHTTLSRRLTKLSDIQFRRLPPDGPIHLLIDSTGLG